MMEMMMADKFAKLFEVDEHQVLFILEEDDESEHEDRERLNQIVHIGGLVISAKIGGLTEAAAAKALADADEVRARQILDHARTLVAHFTTATA